MQRASRKVHQSPKPQIQILLAGAHQAKKGAHYPPHSHTKWELVYYRSGAVGCVMEGQTTPGYPGLAWLTPPGVTHAEQAVAAYANFYIGLEIQHAAWPVFLDDDGDGSLGRVCQQIVVEWNRETPQRGRMLELLAEQLACLLQRASSDTILARPAQIVARAERIIEERCRYPLTIREVAQAVHASPSALRGYFQEVRGCSPREHLQRVRLGKAVTYLRTSTLKLEAIAEFCGYDSASHLTRCVKKAMGRTPGRIRARSSTPNR